MSREDIKQELRFQVVKTWAKKRGRDNKLGWWFFRLSWHCLNLAKKSNRTPLDNSISLNNFTDGDTDAR